MRLHGSTSPELLPEASGDGVRAFRFALRAVLFALPILAWQAFSLASVLGGDEMPYQILQRYQEAKLVPDSTVQTVLLGDSSLGNGIDAAQFSDQTGSQSVSLALTGLYGYAGSLNMLVRADEAYPRLRNVVLVHTPDMLTRSPSPRGLFLTMGSASRLREIVHKDGIASTASEAASFFASRHVTTHLPQSLWRGYRGPTFALMDGDYTRQPARRAPLTVSALTPEAIQPQKTRYLQALAREARARGLTLVYAHGPLWDVQAEASGAYLDAAERVIIASGVPMSSGIETLTTEEVGNAPDHVAPAFQAEVTVRYARRLKPYLR